MAPRVVRVSSENNDFQHADVLRRNRHKRQRYGEFLLEGVQPLNLALAHGWRVTAFYYSPDQLSDWASGILRRSAAPVHYALPQSLLAKLSGKDEPSELLAAVAMPPDDLARIPLRAQPLLVIFDRPASPGNLGTLIRSCDALGADGLVVTGHGADRYAPETISASRGSLFALPVVRAGGPNDLLPWLDRVRQVAGALQVVACDEEADRDVWALDLRRPTALLLGNETWGLSAAYRALADAHVRIPMRGAASSLNVAVAGAIVLYEAQRQRSVDRGSSRVAG
jgi:TrmH family RNA methyltransferase